MNERFVQDGKLEARVESTSQNAKGWFIRLLLHPSDTEEVTKLRVGAVLDIRWREVLNVEVEPIELASVAQGQKSSAKSEDLGSTPSGSSKPRQRFADLPLSQQCAMRCQDGDFQSYVLGIKRLRHSSLAAEDDEMTASAVRAYCGVESRAEIDTNAKAAAKWEELESMYQIYLLDKRYPAETRR